VYVALQAAVLPGTKPHGTIVVDKMMKKLNNVEIFSGLQDQILYSKPRKYLNVIRFFHHFITHFPSYRASTRGARIIF
jgi:hypothetical protein